jgi:hypothetical protein
MDFSNFLHNPWKYQTKEEAAAVLIFKRKERFILGYYIDNEIKELLRLYFGETHTEELEKYGLVKPFKNLQVYVEQNNLIGLILYGTDINNYKIDEKLNTYITNTGGKIDLTISSITQRLILDYIKKENVDILCRKTPNFDIYYNNNMNN